MHADRQAEGDGDFGRAALARLATRLARLPASHPSSPGYGQEALPREERFPAGDHPGWEDHQGWEDERGAAGRPGRDRQGQPGIQPGVDRVSGPQPPEGLPGGGEEPAARDLPGGGPPGGGDEPAGPAGPGSGGGPGGPWPRDPLSRPARAAGRPAPPAEILLPRGEPWRPWFSEPCEPWFTAEDGPAGPWFSAGPGRSR
jgi:hypothetical protein